MEKTKSDAVGNSKKDMFLGLLVGLEDALANAGRGMSFFTFTSAMHRSPLSIPIPQMSH